MGEKALADPPLSKGEPMVKVSLTEEALDEEPFLKEIPMGEEAPVANTTADEETPKGRRKA